MHSKTIRVISFLLTQVAFNLGSTMNSLIEFEDEFYERLIVNYKYFWKLFLGQNWSFIVLFLPRQKIFFDHWKILFKSRLSLYTSSPSPKKWDPPTSQNSHSLWFHSFLLSNIEPISLILIWDRLLYFIPRDSSVDLAITATSLWSRISSFPPNWTLNITCRATSEVSFYWFIVA